MDSMLRVVSNRCRNLRKVIDRARALEGAERQGQHLNEEQRESVRGLARKEALLAELQEILKKQTAVVEPSEPETRLSRRAQKAAKAKTKGTRESARSVSEKSSEEGERAEKGPESDQGGSQEGQEAGHPTGNGNGVLQNYAALDAEREGQRAAELEAAQQEVEKLTVERDTLLKEMAELNLSHEHQLVQDKKEAISQTLNLFHVADFLRQPGSREALLSYYETPEGKISPFILNGLHLDLVCYFNVMLTSPNGNVPHPEAVDVSTAHCIEFLKGATTDAFRGTSYAALVEIVDAIASCPILTDRGVEPGEGKRRNRSGRNRNKANNRPQSSSAPGIEPSHMVDNAVTDSNLP